MKLSLYLKYIAVSMLFFSTAQNLMAGDVLIGYKMQFVKIKKESTLWPKISNFLKLERGMNVDDAEKILREMINHIPDNLIDSGIKELKNEQEILRIKLTGILNELQRQSKMLKSVRKNITPNENISLKELIEEVVKLTKRRDELMGRVSVLNDVKDLFEEELKPFIKNFNSSNQIDWPTIEKINKYLKW